MKTLLFLSLMCPSAFALSQPSPSVDYESLIKSCESAPSKNCCLSSVNIMKDKNVLPVPQEGCSPGQHREMLKCLGSMSWCEPALVKK